MTIIRRFKNWLNGWFGSQFGYTASLDSPARSSIQDFALEGEKHLSPQARWQLLKKSNWLYNNFGLVKALINKPVRYAVGGGIMPSAVTTDIEWNKRADDWFESKADSKDLDISETMDFWSMQRAVGRHVPRDGEAFCLLISRGKEQKIQLLEAAKIGFNAFGMAIQQPYAVDGIEHDDYGKALTFWFKDFMSMAVPVNANDILHIYDPERFGQTRGIPWMHHGINEGIDIVDLAALEKRAAKIHAAFAAIVKKKTGGFADSNFSDLGVNGAAPKANPQLDKMLGGQIAYLELDEEVQFLTSSRPAMNVVQFSDWLVRDIAVGFGVTPEFIWSVKDMGGANTRYILADANVLIQDLQHVVINPFSKPVYRWLLAGAMDRGELPVCKDPAFWLAHWQTPPAITVDRGKEGKLWSDYVQKGLMTLDEFWSMQGRNPIKMRRQRIQEIAEDMAYCKELGVPYELYMPPATSVTTDPTATSSRITAAQEGEDISEAGSVGATREEEEAAA